VDAAWDAATTLGLENGASPDRLRFTADMREAVADADLVQENAPERAALKVKLFAEIDDAAPQGAIIASSSSSITMSVTQAECRHPERTVIAHPFNPPHVVPLVEVVGGTRTAPETIRDAMSFYASIGKRPVHLRKEIPGHVANRLQAALYREVVYLIEQGVLDVADSDDAVSWGPGLRWGVMGPNLSGTDGRGDRVEGTRDPVTRLATPKARTRSGSQAAGEAAQSLKARRRILRVHSGRRERPDGPEPGLSVSRPPFRDAMEHSPGQGYSGEFSRCSAALLRIPAWTP
jgi:hypothetical protein